MVRVVARTTDQIIVLEPPPPHKLFDYLQTIRVYPPRTPARSPNRNNAFDVMRTSLCVHRIFQRIIINYYYIILLYTASDEHGVIQICY